MTNKAFILKKEVYGKTLYYPNCAASRAIAAIAGKKTLTKDDMKMALNCYLEFWLMLDDSVDSPMMKLPV